MIMLVSAFAGRENILNAYGTAVKERYGFQFGSLCSLNKCCIECYKKKWDNENVFCKNSAERGS